MSTVKSDQSSMADKMEAEVQRLLERNRDLSDKLDESLKLITRLRRQRCELLDTITANYKSRHPNFNNEDDEDDDDDSSVYDDDDDLGELSAPSSDEASSSSSEESAGEESTWSGVDGSALGQKRKRAPVGTGTSRKNRHRLVAAEKDEAGDYIMPIQLGTIKLISLGRIISDNPSYHNNRYIFPVGYQIERLYKSMLNPDNMVTYTCSIQEGTSAPKFCIAPSDQPSMVIERDNPTAAWSTVMKEANRETQRTHFAVSGPEYFGLSHPSVAMMIQELPNATACTNYMWRTFDDYQVAKPRSSNPPSPNSTASDVSKSTSTSRRGGGAISISGSKRGGKARPK
ncbi:F/Y-rich N-terminus-domain-containing protein [Dichotomocladium elegans]|nr:F/Y-rich N-terminus-domain-containing protein [Dichotomocladium elegans]